MHAHRIYWRLKRLSLLGAEQWFSDQFRIENRQPPLTRMILIIIGFVISIPLLAATYVVLITILFKDLSWLDGLAFHSWFWVLYLGATFGSAYFVKRRIGKTLHCTACEYQIAPVGPRPATCPECGANFSIADAVSKGRQIGSGWGVVLPIALFTFIFFLPIFNLWSGWQLSASNLVPTQILVDHIIATDDLDYQLGEEIESRRLDDNQIKDLLDEIERRMQVGANYGLKGDDSRYWGMKVSELIAEEANRRTLPHPMKVRLLQLSREWEDVVPYDIEQLVDIDVRSGVFSQAELLAAEMLRPIKKVPTGEFVQQVLSAEEIDAEVWDELETIILEDEILIALLDELERRLRALGPNEDYPGLWDFHIGNLIEAQSAQRRLGKVVELRLLWLDEQYEKCNAGISLWVYAAIKRGVYSRAEIEAARSGRTDLEDEE